jgi:hypothetical protein
MAERHDDYASRFGEVVRDISTECTLRPMYDDAVYASEAEPPRLPGTCPPR